MSNQDKAAKALYGATTLAPAVCQDLAGLLHNFGLLAPDLQEIEFDEEGTWRENEEEPDIFVLTQGLPRGFVGICLVDRDENRATIHARPVEETREFAHALLAAANAAEEQK